MDLCSGEFLGMNQCFSVPLMIVLAVYLVPMLITMILGGIAVGIIFIAELIADKYNNIRRR